MSDDRNGPVTQWCGERWRACNSACTYEAAEKLLLPCPLLLTASPEYLALFPLQEGLPPHTLLETECHPQAGGSLVALHGSVLCEAECGVICSCLSLFPFSFL